VFRSAFTSVATVGLSAVIAGCGGSPTSPSNNAAFSQTDVRVGTGADAVTGSRVTVNYTGWLYNASQPDQKGAQFDSSIGQPEFSFTLGAGSVIAGWEQGVVGMKVGGLRRLVIPPALAYGAGRNGPIPPNATLVFEIELLNVQ
jgi:FKBP-type peptidyl-prolyl cis-trans isomerase FkpA